MKKDLDRMQDFHWREGYYMSPFWSGFKHNCSDVSLSSADVKHLPVCVFQQEDVYSVDRLLKESSNTQTSEQGLLRFQCGLTALCNEEGEVDFNSIYTKPVADFFPKICYITYSILKHFATATEVRISYSCNIDSVSGTSEDIVYSTRRLANGITKHRRRGPIYLYVVLTLVLHLEILRTSATPQECS